nr:MAG TPA: hypothetical protein [Caudoviricetes sp.]
MYNVMVTNKQTPKAPCAGGVFRRIYNPRTKNNVWALRNLSVSTR